MSKFTIICGPCVIDENTYEIAQQVRQLKYKYAMYDWVFKASYTKANRTELSAFRGSMDNIVVLRNIQQQLNMKTITDVHETAECLTASKFANVLQIPAFLMRQTPLLLEAARYGQAVMLKVQQTARFSQVKAAVEKVQSINQRVSVCYRGSAYGSELVFELPLVRELKNIGVPVIVDITHTSGGDKQRSLDYARAVAPFVDGLFMEVYPNPEKALSDGKLALTYEQADKILSDVHKIRELNLEV